MEGKTKKTKKTLRGIFKRTKKTGSSKGSAKEKNKEMGPKFTQLALF